MTKRPRNESLSRDETVWLKHLDFIQNIITRMSKSSAQTKTWLLPVVTATFGYAITQYSGSVALLGLAAVLVFGYMDASYLRQEKAYRRLYNAVAQRSKHISEMSLDPNDIEAAIPDADGQPSPALGKRKARGSVGRVGGEIRKWFFLDPRVWLSWSIAPFYGSLLVAGACVLYYALAN